MIEQQPEHDPEQNPFLGISPQLTEHLKQEMWTELNELGEVQHVMHQLEGKAHRRVRKVQKHMMHCGECLSEQIKSGMLITLPDYWSMHENAGGGRYPKLHYQVN